MTPSVSNPIKIKKELLDNLILQKNLPEAPFPDEKD